MFAEEMDRSRGFCRSNRTLMTSFNQLQIDDVKSVWHPYTQHQTALPPIPIVEASGQYLYSADGKCYTDFIASWWVNIHGHCHPCISKAIASQALTLDHVMFAGFTHEPASKLATRLIEETGFSEGKVFYSDNGSTAVESALKIAIQYWKNIGTPRNRVIAFNGAYHGDTFGAMSVGKTSGFFNHFRDYFFSVDFFSPPNCWHGHDVAIHDAEAIELFHNYLIHNADQCVAVIVEPLVQGSLGMKMHSPFFLEQFCKLAKQYGVLVIFDEVMTGFGRTGQMFAYKHLSIKPDILCLSKGITGGTLPLGATIVGQSIFDSFKGDSFASALAHGHSYTANPIACSAANASLDIFKSDKTMEKIKVIDKWLLTHFLKQFLENPLCENTRVLGCIAATEIKYQASEYASKYSQQLQQKLLSKGFLIRPLGNVIYLMPPYCISENDIKTGCVSISETIEEVYYEMGNQQY